VTLPPPLIGIIFAVLFVVLPTLVVTREGLRRYAVMDAAGYALALGTWFLCRFLGIEIDPFPSLVALGIAKLSLLFIFCAAAREREVRCTPGRIGAAAALVYVALIPAMLQVPMDGDEPYYVLIAHSLLHDRDVDLRNQYHKPAGVLVDRPDLGPQPGDPVGPHGEQYSRHEPFLPLLILPGYAVAGVPGAMLTIAIFGGLLIRSTARLFEEEGITDPTARIVLPFLAFGPPVVWYAMRIWPEVPAAFFMVEAIRGVRQQRGSRWAAALLALGLMKVRFVLVAAPLALSALVRESDRRRQAIMAAAIIATPLLVLWITSGNPLNVHSVAELAPFPLRDYAVGMLGLVLDGAAGVLFQAPFLLLGLVALVRWRSSPAAFRLGLACSSIYLLYLVPRAEWHGGWSPPLRYVVFLMPLLGLGAASVIDRARAHGSRGVAYAAAATTLSAFWTAGLVAHGVSFPWRLFHIASGENAVGEQLSLVWHSDFSRLFPSFIRLNEAALVGSVIFIGAMVAIALGGHRIFIRVAPPQILAGAVSLLLAVGFKAGMSPGRIVEFEDVHVMHYGGELFPEEYQVARFLYRGGWRLRAGDSLSALFASGPARLRYRANVETLLEVSGHAYVLPPSPDATLELFVDSRSPRVVVRCISGDVILDRMAHE
jgi:hypothetical protein